MRIVHIITSLEDGGAERTLFKVCTREAIHEHVVVSLSGEQKYVGELQKQGITVHTLEMGRRVNLPKILELVRLLRVIRPDIIQTWMPHADLLGSIGALLSGSAPIVWNIRTSNYSGPGNPLATKTIVRILALLSWIIPDKIIACSYSARASHVNMGYHGKKIVVVQNGFEPELAVSEDRIHPVTLNFLEARSDAIKFGMVGRFHPDKGHRKLIESLSALKRRGKDFSCVFVGKISDSDRRVFQKLLGDHSLDEEVLIAGPMKNPSELYSRIDIHISASTNEGFPNVVAESMLFGKPNIVTDVGDASAIVGDTGWVVSPNAPSEMLEALIASCETSAEEMSFRSLGARHRILDLFSLERMTSGYTRVYQEIIAKDLHLAE